MKNKLIEFQSFLRKRSEDKDFWWSVALVIALSFLMIKSFSVAFTDVFSFDGAIAAQVARNFARNLQYATDYDQIMLFDSQNVIGITVVLPAAIFFKIFGEIFSAGLLVNAIYLILLIFVSLYHLIYQQQMPKMLGLIFVVTLLGIPKLTEYGFGLYGEIPMLFYFILAVIYLYKYENTNKQKNLFLVGVFLALSFLTKVQIMICGPAFLFSFLYSIIIVQKGQKEKINFLIILKNVGVFFGGVITPIAIFELFRLISVGISNYQESLKAYLKFIFNHPAINLSTTSDNLLNKFNAHLDILASYLKINFIIVLAILSIILLAFIILILYGIKIINKKERQSTNRTLTRKSFIFLLITTLSYFGWWLIITDLAWERYIFPGIFLLNLCLIILLKLVFEFYLQLHIQNNKYSSVFEKVNIIYISLLFIYSLYALLSSGNYRIDFHNSSEKIANLNAAEVIKELPGDAQIFGYNLWEAPILAFASGRYFDNIYTESQINDYGTLEEKYFVYDFSAYYVDPVGFKNILEQFETEPVFLDRDNKIFIYQLLSRSLFSYNAFSRDELAEVNYSKINFRENKSDVFTRNVYINEDNPHGKWVQKTSAYLFKYRGESQLEISFYIPDLSQYSRKPVEIDVYINQELENHFLVDEEGFQNLLLDLETIEGNYLELTIVSNSQNIIEEDERDLSLFIINIELLQ